MVEDLPVRRKPLWPAIPAAVVLAGLVGVVIYGMNQKGQNKPVAVAQAAAAQEDRSHAHGPMFNTPFYMPGIRLPPTSAADAVPLADDTEVIGIQAGGRFRAYRLEAFNKVNSHVVNDLVGNVPISVTHCDRTGCTKVFTGETPGKPLAIDLGGYSRGNMLLKFGGQYYDQQTGRCTAPGKQDLDVQTHEFVQTTWKAWKQAHPDTDIYLAPPDSEGPPPQP